MFPVPTSGKAETAARTESRALADAAAERGAEMDARRVARKYRAMQVRVQTIAIFVYKKDFQG